jgi:hypothetical protein
MLRSIALVTILLTALECSAQQDKITIYKEKFKASEIVGEGKRFGPEQVQDKNKTILFDPPVATGDLYDLMGKIYTTEHFADTREFLNIISDEPLPILDSINFTYYSAYAFIRVLNNDPFFQAADQNSKYKDFKNKYKAATTIAKKRELVDSDENKIYRNALEKSRFTTFRPAIPIVLTTKITSALKLGLVDTISAKIKGTVGLNLNMDNSFKDSLYQYIEVESCTYNEIRYQESYITTAKRILSGFDKNRDLLTKYNDDFTDKLADFLKADDESIITGAAILSAKFNYEKLKQFQLSLGAKLAANANLSKKDIEKMVADITASFAKGKTTDLKINTAQTSYYIRYTFSPELELGAGGTSGK